MLAINKISPSFQAKPSCSKLAAQKAERLPKYIQEILAKKEAATVLLPPDASFMTMPKSSILDEVAMNKFFSSQAAKEYRVTSQKLAEQKGARLFQEV